MCARERIHIYLCMCSIVHDTRLLQVSLSRPFLNRTLPMIVALAFFQLLSFGTFPPGAKRHITAAVTFVTAVGGVPKDLSSVKLF